MKQELTKVIHSIDINGVATVTLNNPDKHNAFDDEVIALLTNTFKQLADNQAVKLVVLASTGKSFCAGADLGWMKRMADYSYEENLADSNALAELFKTINFMPQPTIAKIQGAAFGGAVGLAACCDMVVAAERASFCLSEVKLGLIPATISPYVINAIGERASRRYFVTAERFFAAKAQELGLVSEVVSTEELDAKTQELIDAVLANGPHAVQAAKQLIADVAGKDINQELISETSKRIASIRVGKEGQEGLTAFFEKRPAAWLASNSNNTNGE